MIPINKDTHTQHCTGNENETEGERERTKKRKNINEQQRQMVCRTQSGGKIQLIKLFAAHVIYCD